MTIFLTVLLTILKVLGMILGSVLALVLFLVLLLLFVPFRYQLVASNDDELMARFQVTWLLHLVRFRFRYIDKKMDYGLWVLFFELPVFDKKPKKKKPIQVSTGKESVSKETPKETQQVHPKDTDSKQNKLTGIFNKVKGKIKEITANVKKVYKIVDDKYNQKAFEHLKNVLIWLLMRIRPRKMKLNLAFSAGSPDKTGQILGGLSIFPMAYRDHWNITPDFVTEESYYKGNCKIKGHIFVFWFVIAAVRVVTNKYCRRLYKKINH